MRHGILTAVLSAAALCLMGCDIEDWGSSDRFKEDFAYSYPLKSGGRLSVESLNGSIEIRSWEKDTIDITGTKYAATEDLLKQLKIDVAADPDFVRIRAIRPSERRGGCGARFILRVPKRLTIERAESSNGGVRVEGIDGNVRIKSSNGGVNVLQVKGDLEATTSNSGIELTQFEGAAILTTSNGRIKADGVRGAFSADTSNSSIDATLGPIDPSRPIKLDTSNGSINLTLLEYKGNEVLCDTSNSSITLRLPEGVNARLKASTSNGSITTDYEVKTTAISKTHLEGTLGNGGATITLDTSNSNIRVLRK